MVMAALRGRLPRPAWAGLLVRPETVLGWHRALVRRKWAAYRGCPRRGRPPISAECRELMIRMAKENPGWGYFRIRGELLKLGHTMAATTIRSVRRCRHPAIRSPSQVELEAILGRSCRHACCSRLLQRRHDLLQAPLRPYICAPGDAPRSAGQLYRRAKRGLDYPAGQEPQLATGTRNSRGEPTMSSSRKAPG